jgi:transposase
MHVTVKQRIISQFLWTEGADPVEIHSRLLHAFAEDAYTLSSVYEWIRAFRTGRTSVVDEHRSGRPRLDHIDSKILSLFQENEFHSTRSLAQELGISVSTVYDRLLHVLGFSLRHLRWVPHLLTTELKNLKVTTSTEMLRILQDQERMNFNGTVTGDESWFFWSIREIISGDSVMKILRNGSHKKLTPKSIWSQSSGPYRDHWLKSGFRLPRGSTAPTSVM